MNVTDHSDPHPPPVRAEPVDAGASETEGWWPAPASEDHNFNSPRRWAGRLAFPLLAVGVVLAWRGVRVADGEASSLPPWAWWTLGALTLLIGLALVRMRHASGR